MDTACPDGWRRALDEIAATPFTTLIPGHGEPMNRAAFIALAHGVRQSARLRRFGAAKDAIASPAGSATPPPSSPTGERAIDAMIDYYLDSRLRAAPEERARYCRPADAETGSRCRRTGVQECGLLGVTDRTRRSAAR